MIELALALIVTFGFIFGFLLLALIFITCLAEFITYLNQDEEL